MDTETQNNTARASDSATTHEQAFGWTKFYQAIADKLRNFRDDRTPLVEGLRDISQRVDGLGYLAKDQYGDGTTGFLKDICPFTTIGSFNRGADSKRKIIAAELAKFLNVREAVPDEFQGIPVLIPLGSWYFGYEKDRPDDQINALWDVFMAAIKLADAGDDSARDEFGKAFDNAHGRPNVAWNLTFGLYWIPPWSFPSLDAKSRTYVSKNLGVSIGRNGPNRRCHAADYLAVMDALKQRFNEASIPVHSYPELCLEAWLSKDVEPSGPPTPSITGAPEPYTVENILKDGCFLEREKIDGLIDTLTIKKNLILQGPPGTGKTWLARRLAFALAGQKDESKVRAVQFHPNLSYEDFVRGWRPTGDGKLSLVDGVFMEMIKAAVNDPSSKFVVVIEEINRGNPAQIFGEMLTLLEADKRTPNDAIELVYPDADGKRSAVHIPENLYVIGTMNIADRSLALVDLAMRRRFAFVGLEPRLGATWRDWVEKKCNIDPALVTDIERRITDLNHQIAADPGLGKQFGIGHSYVTPSHRLKTGESRKWFRQVVETEIAPLLEEYWFDQTDEAQKARDRLLLDW
jgi:5-methylcytosine-specific restriction protein B